MYIIIIIRPDEIIIWLYVFALQLIFEVDHRLVVLEFRLMLVVATIHSRNHSLYLYQKFLFQSIETRL